MPEPYPTTGQTTGHIDDYTRETQKSRNPSNYRDSGHSQASYWRELRASRRASACVGAQAIRELWPVVATPERGPITARGPRRCGSPWPSISAPTGSRSGTNALVTSADARDGAGMLARPMRACRRVRAGRLPSGRKHARRRPRGWLAERTGLDRRKRSVSSRSAAEVCWNAPSRLPIRDARSSAGTVRSRPT